jgi:malonate transporter and related proteins
VQTVASFLTIPAVMWAAGLVAGTQAAGG